MFMVYTWEQSRSEVHDKLVSKWFSTQNTIDTGTIIYFFLYRTYFILFTLHPSYGISDHMYIYIPIRKHKFYLEMM